MKYIPNFLLPSIKPKVIDNIVIKDNIVGKVIGVNLKPFDVNHQPSLDMFLIDVKKLRTFDDTILFIEGQENFSSETIKYIEEYTDMEILNGENIKMKNLSSVIKEVYAILKKDPQEKEILIICDNTDMTKKVIKSMAKDFRFITTVGINKDEHDDIYNYILEETGLSLFYTSNIDKILENYTIIINFMDNAIMDFSKVKRNSLIFNFGRCKFPSNGKRPPFIEDFAYDINDLDIVDNKWLYKKIRTDLWEALVGNKVGNIGYLFAENRFYTVKEYIGLYTKIKGKV